MGVTATPSLVGMLAEPIRPIHQLANPEKGAALMSLRLLDIPFDPCDMVTCDSPETAGVQCEMGVPAIHGLPIALQLVSNSIT